MASAIDATKPVAGSPTTQSVRDNFATAASEITALQATAVATPVSVANGGTNATTAPAALANLGGAPLASPALTGSPTVNGAAFASGHLPGTVTNDNAAAGQVGEYLATTGAGGGVANGTPASIMNVSLTAGDWDVWGRAAFTPSATTMAGLSVGISTVNNAFSGATDGGGYMLLQASWAAGGAQNLNTGVARISIAATTTVYLVAQANFAGGGVTVSGLISARRAR